MTKIHLPLRETGTNMNHLIDIERIIPRNDNGWNNKCCSCNKKYVEEAGGVKIRWRLKHDNGYRWSMIWQDNCLNCFNRIINDWLHTLSWVHDNREAILQ